MKKRNKKNVSYTLSPEIVNWLDDYCKRTYSVKGWIVEAALIDFKNKVERENKELIS